MYVVPLAVTLTLSHVRLTFTTTPHTHKLDPQQRQDRSRGEEGAAQAQRGEEDRDGAGGAYRPFREK